MEAGFRVGVMCYSKNQGGAGETVRRELLKQADVHTAASGDLHLSRPGCQNERVVPRPETFERSQPQDTGRS